MSFTRMPKRSMAQEILRALALALRKTARV